MTLLEIAAAASAFAIVSRVTDAALDAVWELWMTKVEERKQTSKWNAIRDALRGELHKDLQALAEKLVQDAWEKRHANER